MDARTLIEKMGGQGQVRKLTGLSKGRISQWVVSDSIPRSWAMFLSEKFPQLDFQKFLEKAA